MRKTRALHFGIMLLAIALCPLSNYPVATLLLPAAQAEEAVPAAEIGHIDFINGDSIVINDSSFLLTAATRYYEKSGAAIKRSSIKENTFVLFQVNAKQEVVSLTLSAPPPMPNQGTEEVKPPPSPLPSSERQKIIFEKGVWHN